MYSGEYRLLQYSIVGILWIIVPGNMHGFLGKLISWDSGYNPDPYGPDFVIVMDDDCRIILYDSYTNRIIDQGQKGFSSE